MSNVERLLLNSVSGRSGSKATSVSIKQNGQAIRLPVSFFRRIPPAPSALQHARQKALGALFLRGVEQLGGRAFFD